MKNHPLMWIAKKVRSRWLGIGLLTLANIGYSLFSVFFALGTRGVIDSAVEGDGTLFRAACLKQAAIIAVILICLTLMRHMNERLRADLEKDWKRKLLHGLLYGDYAAVKEYHSAELLNRLNNDVTKVNDGILSILPSTAAMATKVIAAVLVLGVLDARFTVWIVALGIVVILATGVMRRKLKDLNKRVSEQDGKALKHCIQRSCCILLFMPAFHGLILTVSILRILMPAAINSIRI